MRALETLGWVNKKKNVERVQLRKSRKWINKYNDIKVMTDSLHFYSSNHISWLKELINLTQKFKSLSKDFWIILF